MKFIAVMLCMFSLPTWAHVFGEDGRIAVNDLTKYSYVVRVVSEDADGNTGYCTGTMVSRDQVLTNAHCIASAQSSSAGVYSYYHDNIRVIAFYGSQDEISVSANYDELNENNHGGAGLVNQERDGLQAYNLSDWAIVRLEAPLGEQIGFVSKSLLDNGANINVKMVSYSSDFAEGEVLTEQECRTRGGSNLGLNFLHDCDNATGSSGASLLHFEDGIPFLVAVNFGFSATNDGQSRYYRNFSRTNYNSAIPANSFIDRISVENDSVAQTLFLPPGRSLSRDTMFFTRAGDSSTGTLSFVQNSEDLTSNGRCLRFNISDMRSNMLLEEACPQEVTIDTPRTYQFRMEPVDEGHVRFQAIIGNKCLRKNGSNYTLVSCNGPNSIWSVYQPQEAALQAEQVGPFQSANL